jgi:hypothetical protein
VVITSGKLVAGRMPIPLVSSARKQLPPFNHCGACAVVPLLYVTDSASDRHSKVTLNPIDKVVFRNLERGTNLGSGQVELRSKEALPL